MRHPNTPALPFGIFLSAALLFMLVSIGACQGTGAKPPLAPDAYSALLVNSHVQLIDVRTPSEYSAGHIGDARLMDWTGGQLEAEWNTLDKARPVMVYCASGRRSAAASAFLRNKGFTDVTDLQGGFNAWSAAGKPVAR
ncbi:MAG: rhodanese-like domain-containing protein [Flavobacteriales bacterium]|nr:rhodanese-like domain-containing protein [Flavobacteriales bacterium]